MRVALGIVVGAIIALMSLTLVVNGLSMAVSSDASDSFYSANGGLSEFRTKMAQMIASSADQGEPSGLNEIDQGTTKDLNTNVSGANLSGINRSADNKSSRDLSAVNQIPINSSAPAVGTVNSSETNISELNSSAGPSRLASTQSSSENSSSVNQPNENRTSGSGGSMVSQSDSISPTGVNFDNRASFNGLWSMQADRQGFGNSGINDRMALNGDFNVHKSVSFRE